MKADPIWLWAYGVTEFRIDMREQKFLMTPIMRDGSEGPAVDISEVHEDFLREHN